MQPNLQRQNKTMNKFFLVICYLFLTVSFGVKLQAQNNVISEGERRELEERFKKLKTFYIADDGTVVYNLSANETQNDSLNNNTTKQETTPVKKEPTRVKVKVDVNEDGEYVVKTEEPDYTLNEAQELDPVHESIIYSASTEEIETETPVVNRATGAEVMSEFGLSPSKGKSQVKKGETPSTKRIVKKQEPNLKSLEEATLVVEDILETLRKEQSQNNIKRKNSIQGRLSGGVNSVKQGRNTYDLTEYSDESKTDDIADVGEDYDTPTYYINGVKSDETEYKKLKSKDIHKRQRKVSRSNPHGEWWVETRVQK